jgi:transposase InsO family protein
MKSHHSITALCQAFGVSKSGYYQWCERQVEPAKRRQEDGKLSEEIRCVHEESRATYGAPRIQACLRQQGRRHGRNRIARLMREQELWGRQKRRFRVVTTDSRHAEPIAPNRLAELPAPTAPNQIWLADITYLKTGQGWLYLAAILDLFSRKIVGWAAGENIDTNLVLQAWNMALLHRRPPAGLVFHSDRGVQYASLDHRRALERAQVARSMSRKGNCYDNATMEAFWSTLKLELIYRKENGYATRLEARAELFNYIETFYNRKRLHSALGYLSPAAFESTNN